MVNEGFDVDHGPGAVIFRTLLRWSRIASNFCVEELRYTAAICMTAS